MEVVRKTKILNSGGGQRKRMNSNRTDKMPPWIDGQRKKMHRQFTRQMPES